MDKLEHVIEEKLNFSDMETEDGGNFKCFRVAKDFETYDLTETPQLFGGWRCR